MPCELETACACANETRGEIAIAGLTGADRTASTAVALGPIGFCVCGTAVACTFGDSRRKYFEDGRRTIGRLREP